MNPKNTKHCSVRQPVLEVWPSGLGQHLAQAITKAQLAERLARAASIYSALLPSIHVIETRKLPKSLTPKR